MTSQPLWRCSTDLLNHLIGLERGGCVGGRSYVWRNEQMITNCYSLDLLFPENGQDGNGVIHSFPWPYPIRMPCSWLYLYAFMLQRCQE